MRKVIENFVSKLFNLWLHDKNLRKFIDQNELGFWQRIPNNVSLVILENILNV
jgi:hypothetical protein